MSSTLVARLRVVDATAEVVSAFVETSIHLFRDVGDRYSSEETFRLVFETVRITTLSTT